MATLPIVPPSLDGLLSAIPSLSRPVLRRLVERMIDRLDETGPDPDEDCGRDEAEPDFRRRRKSPWDGPGCKISDSDFGVDDVPHDHDDGL